MKLLNICIAVCVPGRGLRRGGIVPGGLQVEKRAVQFNQCGRQQSVVATSGPYVIRFVYSVHYLVTLVTQSFFLLLLFSYRLQR